MEMLDSQREADPMKVLVCGSRSWDDYDAVHGGLAELMKQHGRFTVMHGAARGADRLAGRAGRAVGLDVSNTQRSGIAWGDEPAMCATSRCFRSAPTSSSRFTRTDRVAPRT